MAKTGTFVGIMVFYAVITYLVFPVVSYYAFQKSLAAAGNGFVAGSVLSLVLWFSFGSKLI
jgi:hypothetical protein